MDWQQIISLGIVLLTAAWIGTRWSRRSNAPCLAGCTCPSGAGSGSQNTIIFRARKGKRPEVVLKFR